MYVVEITFARESCKNAAAQYEAVDLLLKAWYLEGHSVGLEPQIVRSPHHFTASVFAVARDAFKLSRCGEYVKKDLARLTDLGLAQPQIKFLGLDPPDSTVCNCKNLPQLLLYTNYIHIGSPLQCGGCGGDVPLYRIPKFSSGEYYEILGWKSDYQACDTLQMGCSTGEKFALREMGELNSSLSQRGLKICREVERLTGTPTYYYLHRYRGRSMKSERARLCPSCGDAWILPEAWHDKFDFRCDKCRLLSNLAYETSN